MNIEIIEQIRSEYEIEFGPFWNDETPTVAQIKNCVGRYVPSVISNESITINETSAGNFELTG